MTGIGIPACDEVKKRTENPYNSHLFFLFDLYRIKMRQNSEEVKWERGLFRSEKNRGGQK